MKTRYSLPLVGLLALLAAVASWGWLQFAKYLTNDNRDNAARLTSWLFGWVATCGALVLLTLAAPAQSQTIVAPPPHTSTVNGFIITEGDITDRPYVPMGTVTAIAGKFSWLQRDPNRSDVDRKLREKAQQMGADAVVRVQYTAAGWTLTRAGGIKGEGLAVKFSGTSASIPQRDEVGLHATKEQLATVPTPPQHAPSETLPPVKVERPEPPQPSSVAPAIAAAAASSGPRYALVIGNSQYGASLGRLANPVNDALSVAAALRAVGFNVDLVTDADQRAMKRAISRFGERLTAAGRGATGLFYYAGHGIQSRGTNYLIPVTAPIEREADLDLEAVAADTVLAQMEEAGAGAATSIVILDACRNMPLARSFRRASRGLARMEAPNGSFIAYSTAPGSLAADGDGRNSPFATALVKQIGQKGTPIEVMFRGIRREVMQATGGQQTPWDSSSLIDPFYFVP